MKFDFEEHEKRMRNIINPPPKTPTNTDNRLKMLLDRARSRRGSKTQNT